VLRLKPPNSNSKRGDRRARQNKRSGSRNVDNDIVQSHHSAARGDVLFDAADISRKRPSWQLIQSPPRNFLTMPHWVQSSFTSSNSLSAGGGVVEQNFAFTLSQFPDAASLTALFDQYCIYSVIARATIDVSAAQASAGGSYGRLHTAIDYDSNGALASETLIERFGSCSSSELVLGKSYERFVKPVCALITGASNATTNTGAAMERCWINNVFTTVPHFGVRFLTVGNQSATSPVLNFFCTAVVGLRNNV